MNKNKSMRITNSINILKHLLRKKMSRVELAEKNNLTKTTITEIIKVFIEMGMIYEESTVSNEMGRPSILLNFIKDYAYVIGIGIMRDGLQGCVIDTQGNLIDKIEKKYTSHEIKLEYIYEIVDAIFSKCKKKNISPKAISFGAPGPLDIREGIIKCPPRLPNIINLPLKKLIHDRYGIYCCIENDADMAAIGEQYYGKGRDLDYFAFVFISNGIGVGTIINNDLYHGQHGFAGELGHIKINIEGTYKILEEEFGFDKIIEKINKKLNKNINTMNLNNLMRSCKDNEQIANIIKTAGINIGSALLAYVNLFGITHLFLGGKCKLFGETFLNSILSFIKENRFYEHDVNIQFSDLGELIISMGAARYGLFKYLENLVNKKFK